MSRIFLVAVIFNICSLSAQTNTETKTDSINNLETVFVKTKQQSPERLPETKNNALFSGKKNEVLKLSSINGNLTNNNTREIFARIPGVTIWENEGSGLQINIGLRGLSPNRSWELNTRQNGVDISADIFGYPEAYYNPPLEAVESIQVVRGGASLQFGPQFGGMINYILRRESLKPFSFETQNTVGSYGLVSSFNAVGSRIKKWSFYAYNQSRSGNSWRNNNRYNSRNTYGFIEYRFNEKNKISAEYTNSDYIMQQPGGLTDAQFEENPQQSTRNRNWFGVPWQVFAINFESKINKNFDFNLKTFGLIGERNSVGFTAAANVNDVINTSTNQYSNRRVDSDLYENIGLENRNLYRYSINNISQNLAFGIRLYQAKTRRFQRGKGTVRNDYDMSIEGEFPGALSFVTKNFAVFAENQFKINKNFSITPGFRYEHINSNALGRLNFVSGAAVVLQEQKQIRNQPLFGFGLEYKINKTNIYGNITQAFRPVLFSDLTPSAVLDEIDPNLKDASGYNADLGYRGVIKDFINFDVGVFYLNYNNRIGDLTKFINDDPSQGTYLYRTNLGQSINRGIESFVNFNMTKILSLDKILGSVDIFASMSFIDSKYQDFRFTTTTGNAPNIIISENNLKGKQVEKAPRYINNFGLSWSKNNFSATVQYKVSGQIYTDANNTKSPSANGQTGVLEGYRIVDFSLEHKFLTNYNFKFGANNLSNKNYATRRSSGYPGPGILSGEGESFYISLGAKF